MKTEKTVKKTTKAKSEKRLPLAHSVGRRKTATARIWLRQGSGSIVVNGKKYTDYFDTEVARLEAARAFQVIPAAASYDVEVLVRGGGLKGQAGAVKLGVARALLSIHEGMRPTLREHDLLTVDSRQKERKKYGQRGARRKFQFVKR
ncbi:MAG: 30S ribosomal protein S9 [Candidatus Babeliales bacterium]